MSKNNNVVTNDTFYHIYIDKSIKNYQDFFQLLNVMLSGFLSWREQLSLSICLKNGILKGKLCQDLGISRTTLANIFAKSNKLVITDDDNRKDFHVTN